MYQYTRQLFQGARNDRDLELGCFYIKLLPCPGFGSLAWLGEKHWLSGTHPVPIHVLSGVCPVGIVCIYSCFHSSEDLLRA